MTRTMPTTNVTRSADVHIIRFSHMDVLEADSLREVRKHISRLAGTEERLKVVLDMEDVVFLTSDAIGMVVAISNAITPRGGRIHLANVSDETYTVFEIFKLQELIRVFDSTEAAIKAFE